MIFNNTASPHRLNIYVYNSRDSQGQSFPPAAFVGLAVGILVISVLVVCTLFHYYGNTGSNRHVVSPYYHVSSCFSVL